VTRDRYKKKPKVEQWRGLGDFGTIGLEIALSIAFGFFGGRWLDGKFGTEPYLAGIGFFFGVAAAIRAVMRAHGQMQKLAEREEREQGNPKPIYDARDDERDDADVRHDEPKTSDDETLEDKASPRDEKADR
jgi:ATP synthase protein I